MFRFSPLHALLCLSLFGMQPSVSVASLCGDLISNFYKAINNAENISVEEKQRSLDETLEENKFNITRDLEFYGEQFSYFSFEEKVEYIKKNGGVIFDAGAGTAAALMDIRQSLNREVNGSKKVKLIALAVKKPSLPGKNVTEALQINRLEKTLQTTDKNEFEYLESNIENLDISKIPKVTILTDLFGPVSYSKNLGQVLQKYMDLLDTQGSIHIAYSEHRMIIQSELQKFTLDEWLQSIPGLEIKKVKMFSGTIFESVSLQISKKYPTVKIPTTIGQIKEINTPPTIIHFIE